MPQGLDEGKSYYRGRSCQPRVGWDKKSAEAIVVGEYELRTDTAEDSQTNEGLNVKQLQMPNGSAGWRKPSLSATGKSRTKDGLF